MIIPGELRHKIIVQKKETTKDEFGSSVETFNNYLVLKAEVKYLGGSKGVDDKEIFTTKQIIFKTYYRDIREDMIIIFNNEKFIIHYINEIPFKQGLEIKAEKINE